MRQSIDTVELGLASRDAGPARRVSRERAGGGKLSRRVGLGCIGAGWICALVLLCVPKAAGFEPLIVELGVVGAALLGFGCGWAARGDAGRGRGAWK